MSDPAPRALPFVKMHGASNDYVYLDLFDDAFSGQLDGDADALAVRISDRRTGVGGDGLILIAPPDAPDADGRMIMRNADGSQAEMCGNGVRCVAKYLHDHVLSQPDTVRVQTAIGTLPIDVVERDAAGRATMLRVDMGPPTLAAASIPTTLAGEPPLQVPLDVDLTGCGLDGRLDVVRVTAISMGNPHAVCFFDDASLVTDRLVHTLGPRIETHPAFPNRTNVEFVICPPGGGAAEFTQRTWERGSGETFACGTGAAAVCVAGILEGRLASRSVGHLLGGDLVLEWDGQGSVFKTGPAVEVFRGMYVV